MGVCGFFNVINNKISIFQLCAGHNLDFVLTHEIGHYYFKLNAVKTGNWSYSNCDNERFADDYARNITLTYDYDHPECYTWEEEEYFLNKSIEDLQRQLNEINI